MFTGLILDLLIEILERFFLSNRDGTLFDINVHKDQRFKTINQTNVIFVLKVGAKAKYFEK